MPASERSQPGARGCVFNIQRYAVHDGPGIRTLVFMKGCPLRCRWCSNPESQHRAPQLAYNAAKCLGGQCLRCVAACRSTAIGVRGDGKAAIERARCAGCAACRDCVDACPSRALHVFGQMLTVDEVLAALRERQPHQHVVFTGRDAPAELIEQADLVTEMREIKHPFRAGIQAQAGIEY